MNAWRGALVVVWPLALQAAAFDPVKDVAISITSGVLSLTVPRGAHLKARLFKVALTSPGILRLGALPASAEKDEAGDPIWRGTVQVELKGHALEDPARLVITYQPCTEGPEGMCFLPVKRTLVVSASEIPAGASE
jgi:hypothetical protein